MVQLRWIRKEQYEEGCYEGGKQTTHEVGMTAVRACRRTLKRDVMISCKSASDTAIIPGYYTDNNSYIDGNYNTNLNLPQGRRFTSI